MFEKWRRTGDTRSPEKKTEDQHILGPWDKKILEEGLEKSVLAMLKDFSGQFPDVLLLPDTSARPLYFALRPIFVELQKRNIKEPICIAFNSRRTPVPLQQAEEERARMFENSNPINSEEELREHYKQTGIDQLIAGQTFIENAVDLADLEEMKHSREVMRQRARDILHLVEKSKADPSVAVFDEFATGNASTAYEIRRAFNMPNMHVYTVFAQEGAPVSAGVEVDTFHEETMNPRMGNRGKLTYSDTVGVGVTKSEEAHQKRSRRIPMNEIVSAKKKQLQSEMRTIGENVAKRLVSTATL